jgi:hypothetical protein
VNRRLFMGLLTGLAALPVAAIAAVKRPRNLYFQTVFVPPREAMSTYAPGGLFAATDTAGPWSRDYDVTVVFKRHGNGIIEIMEDFEWPHTAVEEHGVERLERIAIDSVRRKGPPPTIFYPTRLHTDDLPPFVVKKPIGEKWQTLRLPRNRL